ncbi:unnamed protein product, partial [Ectocarpus sp. 12 AP-2014]
VACYLLQYYGEVLSKKPVELHRFYKDESTFCHASGTKEEVMSPQRCSSMPRAVDKLMKFVLVVLNRNDANGTNDWSGGVLLMVTGSITIANTDPRQFCQTFFLARQHQ